MACGWQFDDARPFHGITGYGCGSRVTETWGVFERRRLKLEVQFADGRTHRAHRYRKRRGFRTDGPFFALAVAGPEPLELRVRNRTGRVIYRRSVDGGPRCE